MEPKVGDCLRSKWCGPRLIKHILGSYVLYVEVKSTMRDHDQRWMTLSAWKAWARTATPQPAVTQEPRDE